MKDFKDLDERFEKFIGKHFPGLVGSSLLIGFLRAEIEQAEKRGITEGINRLAEVCEIDFTDDIEQALAEMEREQE